MIKFFRNIRKSLLNEGKTSKYLKYALGEIVLVVLGILIALQINNWNQDRKSEEGELKLLHEINLNLKDSSLMLEYVMEDNEKSYEAFKLLLTHIEQKKPYHTDLDTIFRLIPTWSSPQLSYTAYESLKSKGPDIIQNDSLKQMITTIYEGAFTYIKEDWEQSEWVDHESAIKPYYVKHFSESIDGFSASPNDYDFVLNDPEFVNILRLVINNRKLGNNTCRGIKNFLEQVTAEIDNELNKRDFRLPNYDQTL